MRVYHFADEMEPLRSRIDRLLHHLTLAPQTTLQADATAIAAAVGLESTTSVLAVVRSAEQALFGAGVAGQISPKESKKNLSVCLAKHEVFTFAAKLHAPHGSNSSTLRCETNFMKGLASCL